MLKTLFTVVHLSSPSSAYVRGDETQKLTVSSRRLGCRRRQYLHKSGREESWHERTGAAVTLPRVNECVSAPQGSACKLSLLKIRSGLILLPREREQSAPRATNFTIPAAAAVDWLCVPLLTCRTCVCVCVCGLVQQKNNLKTIRQLKTKLLSLFLSLLKNKDN